jgi:hypothetical protein
MWLFVQLLRDLVSNACTAWPNVAVEMTAEACGVSPVCDHV